jgi:hypothetical protein
MFSQQSGSLNQAPLAVYVMADRLYQTVTLVLNRHLETLATKYCLTLKDSHNGIIIKFQKLINDLDAMQKDKSICTPDYKKKIEEALSDIETHVDMMQVTIDDLRTNERVTFANIKVYPESYLDLVKDMNGPIQQTIKIFNDYKSKKSSVLHPKRHHMPEAKKIIDFCELVLKNQEWSDAKKVEETRNFIVKVKNGLLGSLEMKIADDSKQLSSFLKRLHFVLDKLLVVVPLAQLSPPKPAVRR